MNTYLVTEIDWDTDGEPHTLPSSTTFASPKQKGLLNLNDDEIVSDYLSDRYGFCVKSFKFKVITWHSDPADEGWDWDSPEERLSDPLVKIIDDDVVCPCCEKKNKNYDSERIKCWSCDELFNNPNYSNE